MRRQRVVETVHCDRCGDETQTATSWRIEMARQSGNGKPLRRIIDTCPSCDAPMAELYDMLRALPAAELRDPVQRPTTACAVCGDTVAIASIGSHLVRKHGASAPQPPRCPDCDHEPYADPTGLIVHRRRIHGYDHAAALLASLDASPKRKRSR